MSDSVSRFEEKIRPVSTVGIGDSVWNYMTSVRAVEKRDGISETFQPEKLRRSLAKIFSAAGLDNERLLQKVLTQVVSRIQKSFDGHTVPSTNDIREIVNLTLIDHNLVHVAKKYMAYRTQISTERNSEPQYGQGITVERFFTKRGVHPYELMAWERRDARITNEKGKVVFEQLGVEVPISWSQTATNIVVSKYFRGQIGKPDRENSIKQLIDRVALTMANWGRLSGYFQTVEDADIFEAELTYILVNQMAAFNSPVWFNVGVNLEPQCSACFINSVQDDMRSILNLAVTEGMLFKGGSGTGSNLSNLRSSREYLAGSNGRASGPVSFMKGLDAFAGVIKSGGKTRRAAKMVILNVDHPDIEDFITCKAEEEKKAWALMDQGYDGSIDGPAYASIYFQNANNSVRVTDDFMQAVVDGKEWVTREVKTGNASVSYSARDLINKMAQATWQCGDPGIQYDTTINRWHTCKNTDRINASNPCSEYMFLDDSACNLASLNLMKFRKEVNGVMEFDTEAFKKANQIIITAMDIIVGHSSYPTPAIEQNSLDYRPLGIGYANLGALLMSRGLAYDSDEGRNLAAAMSSLQSGICYEQSARIAEKMEPFVGFRQNVEPCTNVMRMHRQATFQIPAKGVPTDLLSEARTAWNNVVDATMRSGLRNAQISVLAPTGTIAFFMDCDTTGIEPDIALVKYKWLVGGGMMKIVNQTIPEALQRLGYSDQEQKDILHFIDEKDTIEGAPYIREEHLGIFDCAFKATNGTRSIHYMGHLRMMAAVQPFISGAISKTVNMPNEATPADIANVFMEGWKLGLKAIAVYRDGSKRQQALTTSREKDQSKKEEGKKEKVEIVGDGRETTTKPLRRRLADERRSITHKFAVGGHEGYLTVGLYDDGTPGELFVRMAKSGTVMSGLMDSFSTAVSIGLQYGVPLRVLVNKFVHVRFEPSGYTNNPHIRIAKSIVDYIFRWIALKFLTPEEQRIVGVNGLDETQEVLIVSTPTVESESAAEAPSTTSVSQTSLFASNQPAPAAATHTATFDNQADAPACTLCGSIMVRNAACYKCLNCGSTSGCS
ncbi:MAG: Ribonucleoside-diphosphate reductase, adenosylcobalamin-dependent [Candidatus Uhrbacteria bacterium GW2011_GWF2_41_16]|uniref:Vitamin B12-dependent ribonucleotide reductase n=2 Tax=Candidatus Uhriibacteriota TaxID=1752732 RepID=A0A0G0VDZ0_9BACT|nr:MAG: Ribonucleoside-diphosphate reductase, adenosylcobalamin-dependent [Candidatus Uhrbacteria bacterium GW2011_GWC2_41_11]KKR97886.1 MAG: Ribonucleoside-diphosphate reductase, adenosylcobalamin-dependent [Candidatus Uhrbacteria bacterium GW2011_GWF2_41_16]